MELRGSLVRGHANTTTRSVGSFEAVRLEVVRLAPPLSVENPSGGASVAYFFYSPLLGYFENIPVQPFDEGRDSLQRRCLEIFSNRLVLAQKHFEQRQASSVCEMAGFEWRKITRRPTLLLLTVVISRRPSRSLFLATNTS
jgi:hypothetical protein